MGNPRKTAVFRRFCACALGDARYSPPLPRRANALSSGDLRHPRRGIRCAVVRKAWTGWPSGLRRTLGKRVGVNASRGFESRSVRQPIPIKMPDPFYLFEGVEGSKAYADLSGIFRAERPDNLGHRRALSPEVSGILWPCRFFSQRPLRDRVQTPSARRCKRQSPVKAQSLRRWRLRCDGCRPSRIASTMSGARLARPECLPYVAFRVSFGFCEGKN